jgi:hypothetical protein
MNKEQYKTYFRQALHAISEAHNSKHVAQGSQMDDSGDLLRAIGDSPTRKSVSRLFTDAGFDPKMLHDLTKEDLGQYSRAEKIAIATGSGMTHLHPDYDAEKHGKGRAVIGIENLAEE